MGQIGNKTGFKLHFIGIALSHFVKIVFVIVFARTEDNKLDSEIEHSL